MKHKSLPTEVVIYTDGSSDPSTKLGGWAAILLFNKNGRRYEKEIYGSAKETTNNRMEIMAMIEGLNALKRPSNITVYTDSKYLKNGMGDWHRGKPQKGWIITWKKLGWRRKDGPLSNNDLWKILWVMGQKQKSIRMKWIRGHSGDLYNEQCDMLATKARLGTYFDWKIVEEDIIDD